MYHADLPKTSFTMPHSAAVLSVAHSFISICNEQNASKTLNKVHGIYPTSNSAQSDVTKKYGIIWLSLPEKRDWTISCDGQSLGSVLALKHWKMVHNTHMKHSFECLTKQFSFVHTGTQFVTLL